MYTYISICVYIYIYVYMVERGIWGCISSWASKLLRRPRNFVREGKRWPGPGEATHYSIKFVCLEFDSWIYCWTHMYDKLYTMHVLAEATPPMYRLIAIVWQGLHFIWGRLSHDEVGSTRWNSKGSQTCSNLRCGFSQHVSHLGRPYHNTASARASALVFSVKVGDK